jgi:hypothetical protein
MEFLNKHGFISPEKPALLEDASPNGIVSRRGGHVPLRSLSLKRTGSEVQGKQSILGSARAGKSPPDCSTYASPT